MTGLIIHGDCREVLRTLPDASVHCCVTSPPYWGLRDYGHAQQIGLEQTPDAYVAEMVAVFREVRRVLREDGTLWLNLGDSYANSGAHGLKAKDLVGMPWRVAFALQSDGWWLRSDCIWAKLNPMPESILDRPTKGHEYVFMLTKSQRYYFDMDAVKEPLAPASEGHYKYAFGGTKAQALTAAEADGPGTRTHIIGYRKKPDGRHIRTVWPFSFEPYTGAHFAVMPSKLAERCILASCPLGGTVLDPFLGAGTTGLVALRLKRTIIGIEINRNYAEMARKRIIEDAPLYNLIELQAA